jgi:hypothetical protein
MDRTVVRLVAATVDHDAILARVFPVGPQKDPGVIDRVWRDLQAVQPELRSIADEAIAALQELYEPHESLVEVAEAIERADADWVRHAIFARAGESIGARQG